LRGLWTDLESSRETRGVVVEGEAAAAAAGAESLDGDWAEEEEERRTGDLVADDVFAGPASMSVSCEIDMPDLASSMMWADRVVMGLFVRFRETRDEPLARMASAMVTTPWSDMLQD
jgi:hypothetical protein